MLSAPATSHAQQHMLPALCLPVVLRAPAATSSTTCRVTATASQQCTWKPRRSAHLGLMQLGLCHLQTLLPSRDVLLLGSHLICASLQGHFDLSQLLLKLLSPFDLPARAPEDVRGPSEPCWVDAAPSCMECCSYAKQVRPYPKFG